MRLYGCSLTNRALGCFTDAHWGGEFSRSTFGNPVVIYGFPISWTLKQLATVAALTAHVEYTALGHGTRMVLWIRELLQDMIGKEVTAQRFCNNQAAVKLCSNDASNKRTRHTDCDFYINKQALFCKQISLTWVLNGQQFANIYTKNLTLIIHKDQFQVLLGRVSARGGVL
jgi:hypothetical protein